MSVRFLDTIIGADKVSHKRRHSENTNRANHSDIITYTPALPKIFRSFDTKFPANLSA